MEGIGCFCYHICWLCFAFTESTFLILIRQIVYILITPQKKMVCCHFCSLCFANSDRMLIHLSLLKLCRCYIDIYAIFPIMFVFNLHDNNIIRPFFMFDIFFCFCSFPPLYYRSFWVFYLGGSTWSRKCPRQVLLIN